MHMGRPKRSVVRETYGPPRSSYAEWRARLHQKVSQLRPLVDTQAAASHETAGLSFKSERCLSARILGKLGGIGLAPAGKVNNSRNAAHKPLTPRASYSHFNRKTVCALPVYAASVRHEYCLSLKFTWLNSYSPGPQVQLA